MNDVFIIIRFISLYLYTIVTLHVCWVNLMSVVSTYTNLWSFCVTVLYPLSNTLLTLLNSNLI